MHLIIRISQFYFPRYPLSMIDKQYRRMRCGSFTLLQHMAAALILETWWQDKANIKLLCSNYCSLFHATYIHWVLQLHGAIAPAFTDLCRTSCDKWILTVISSGLCLCFVCLQSLGCQVRDNGLNYPPYIEATIGGNVSL